MAGKRLRRSRVHRLKKLRPAPGELRLLQAFLNTADLEVGSDELSSVHQLGDWLEHHRLLAQGAELERVDVQRAIEFRESFRKMVAVGESASRELGQAVDRTLVSALVCSRFEAGGELRLQPAVGGLGGALGGLLAIINDAQRDGSWPRFKICVYCHAAFYDYSTNRSGLWCLPRCGSLVRGRDFRRRKGR